nr:hypothetical protein [Anaerolineae bacterium]
LAQALQVDINALLMARAGSSVQALGGIDDRLVRLWDMIAAEFDGVEQDLIIQAMQAIVNLALFMKGRRKA